MLHIACILLDDDDNDDLISCDDGGSGPVGACLYHADITCSVL